MTKIPLGVTCHYERDQEGQWWVVWGANFPGNEQGRALAAESDILEIGYQEAQAEFVQLKADHQIELQMMGGELTDKFQAKLKQIKEELETLGMNDLGCIHFFPDEWLSFWEKMLK